MSETTVAQAIADVMLYSEHRKAWHPPDGTDGKSHVQILQHNVNNGFRIVAVSAQEGFCVLNCNIHLRLKYHTATPTFHQWRDEQRQVYGLNFTSEADANLFVMAMSKVQELLTNRNLHGNSEYHSIQHDNVYQDPQQHLQHIQSAPNFRDNDNSLHPSFRKSSHAVQGNDFMNQQQRRSSQGSNASPVSGSMNGGPMYQQQQPLNHQTRAPPAPPAPPAAAPPPAPPPPPAGLATGNAPPAPPPPPPNLMSAKLNGGTSLVDQLKNASLKKTGGVKENRSQSLAESSGTSAPPPPSTSNGGAHGCLINELAATINKRKMNQAKADAADNSDLFPPSPGSSDSGCGGIQPPSNGVKKWESVKTNGHTDSPKTHRKVPSGSSISSQEEIPAKPVGSVTAEYLERFKADLMVEVRLEINKAKQDIIEALKMELSRK
ncbi:unnamed protein product [Auanema sp. JU1783]|nr:unnamed protein product [Auanema sp. JU1783]